MKLPAAPVFFTKAPTSVIGPHDDVPWDRTATQQVDWEAELGAIVGVTGLNIPRANALDHVFVSLLRHGQALFELLLDRLKLLHVRIDVVRLHGLHAALHLAGQVRAGVARR